MKRLLSIVAVMMAIVSLAGCKQDQVNDDMTSNNDTSVIVPDPEGTVTVNITSSGYTKIYGAELRLSNGNLGAYYNAEDHGELVSLGQANGLGDLNTSDVPKSGWNRECAAVSGALYICRNWSSNLPGTIHYCGIYVVSYNGGDTATIKFCGFEPGVGWK